MISEIEMQNINSLQCTLGQKVSKLSIFCPKKPVDKIGPLYDPVCSDTMKYGMRYNVIYP